MKRKYDDASQRQRDLESLSVIAERYNEIEQFLSDLAIDPPDFSRGRPEDDGEDELLTLTTVHSAKGLEWHSVFILQLNTGRFPNYNALNNDDDYEEERRLLYVAVTRARRNLYLMKPEEIVTRSQSYEVGELSPLLQDVKDLHQLVDEQTYAPGTELPELDGEGSGNDDDQLQLIQDYFSDS